MNDLYRKIDQMRQESSAEYMEEKVHQLTQLVEEEKEANVQQK